MLTANWQTMLMICVGYTVLKMTRGGLTRIYDIAYGGQELIAVKVIKSRVLTL